MRFYIFSYFQVKPRIIYQDHRAGLDLVDLLQNKMKDFLYFLEMFDDLGKTDDRRHQDEVQKLTDKAIKDVDEVVKAKEQELMAV